MTSLRYPLQRSGELWLVVLVEGENVGEDLRRVVKVRQRVDNGNC